MNYFQSGKINPNLAIPGARFGYQAETYGGGAIGTTTPGIEDVVRFVSEGLIKPISDGLRQAAQNFSDTTRGQSMLRPVRARRPGDWNYATKHWKDECCEPCCWEDPCHCTCCIVDADLVIYARLGERRVVPLSIENRWRRERKIKLDLSTWTTRGGNSAQVQAHLLPPAPEFTLGPCARESVALVVETNLGANTAEAARTTDVDDCTVYYADLRVEGCEIRPIRIALAILPRDCGTYQIICNHGCC